MLAENVAANVGTQDTERVRIKVPPCFSFRQIGGYLWLYPSCMLDIHIIYCKEMKDIGECHCVWIGLLHSLGRAAGRSMAFDSGVKGGRG